MHDPGEGKDLDVAYKAAVTALSTEDSAARRRAAVLAAVRDQAERSRIAGRKQASNDPGWHRRSTWLGATAAACLAGISLLLVLRLGDDPTAGRDSDESVIASRKADTVVDDRGRLAGGSSASTAGQAEADTPRSLHEASTDRSAGVTVASPPAQRVQSPDATQPPPTPPAAREAAAERSLPPAAAPAAADPQTALRAHPSQDVFAGEVPQAADKERMRQPPGAVPTNNASSEQGAALLVPKAEPGLRADQAAASSPAIDGTLAAAPTAKARSMTSGLIASASVGDLEGLQRQLTTTQADSQRDSDGRTALAIAVLRSDVRMVSVLLTHGANRLSRDHQGRTPMDHAAAADNPAVLKALER